MGNVSPERDAPAAKPSGCPRPKAEPLRGRKRLRESAKFACAVGVRLPDEQREEPRRGRKGSSGGYRGGNDLPHAKFAKSAKFFFRDATASHNSAEGRSKINKKELTSTKNFANFADLA